MDGSVGHARDGALAKAGSVTSMTATARCQPGREGLQHLKRLTMVVKQRMAGPGGQAARSRTIGRCRRTQPLPLPGQVAVTQAVARPFQCFQRPPAHRSVAEQQFRQGAGAQPPDRLPGPSDGSNRHAAAGPDRRAFIDAQHNLSDMAHAAAQRMALLGPQPSAALVKHLHANRAVQAQARRQRPGGRQPLAQAGGHRCGACGARAGASAGDANPPRRVGWKG